MTISGEEMPSRCGAKPTTGRETSSRCDAMSVLSKEMPSRCDAMSVSGGATFVSGCETSALHGEGCAGCVLSLLLLFFMPEVCLRS